MGKKDKGGEGRSGGRKDGWMDEWSDRWMDGCMHAWRGGGGDVEENVSLHLHPKFKNCRLIYAV